MSDFAALPFAGSRVVALAERVGSEVELTVRTGDGADHLLEFVEPLAFEARWLIDVELSAGVVTDDPWVAEVCAQFGEDPALHRCFALVGGAGDARFRIVARDFRWS